MAYSDTQWDKAKTLYEAGLSLSKIKDKTGIARNTISQRAKREQWEHSTDADYIEAKEIIAIKKGTKTEQQISVLDEVADERTKHILLFQSSAIKNQTLANKAIDTIDKDKIDEKNLHSLETHSRITQRNKETVLGKDKTVELNNTNAQQTNNTKRVTIVRRTDRT